jgi:hypothetical protein
VQRLGVTLEGQAYPRRPMDRMPEPGDPCPGFIVEPGRCWHTVYSLQLQATDCPQGAGLDRSLALAPW